MRFSMNPDLFSEAVSFPVAMLPSRITQPILGGVLLEAVGDAVTFSIFNFEVSAKTAAAAIVHEPGRALVSGRLLANIARKLPGAEVEVRVLEGKVEISSGSARFNLPAMPVEEYPQLPQLDEITGEVRGEDFRKAVAQVFPAASNEDVTPTLNGIFFEIKDNVLSLTATDRYRIATRGIDFENQAQVADMNVIVPAKTVNEAAKQLSHAERVQIVIQTNGERQQIGFIGDNKAITTQLIAGTYPPVSRLFPTDLEHYTVVNTADLRAAVERVALVVENDAAIRFNFTEGRVTLSGTGSEAAAGTDGVDAHLAGAEVTVALRPSFLRDGLNGADSDYTRIVFGPSATERPGPVLILGQRSKDDADDNSFKYLQQPNLLMS